MLEAATAATILVITLAGSRVWGAAMSAALTFLVFAMLLPRNLLVWGLPDDLGYDVEVAAGAGPSVMTHGAVVLVAAVVIAFSQGRRAFDPLSLLALVSLPVAALFLWPESLRVAGGVVYLATAVCAWVFGRYIGMPLTRTPDSTRVLVIGLCALLGVEVIWALLQMITGRVDVNGRPVGSFDHAAVLGKNAIIFLLILLPATRSLDRITRVAGWLGVAAAVLGTVLTGSRANLLGIGIVVVLWTLLLPRSEVQLRWKLLVPVALVVVASPFIPKIVQRFLDDPEGGDRPELLAAGLRIIDSHLLTGTGPNNYVATAAASESIVQRTGYPIHNTFLLPIAELGLVVAAIYAMFLLLPLINATTVMVRSDGQKEKRDTARAVLVVFVGLLPVAWTGWGLLGWNSFFLLMFCAGYAFSTLRTPSTNPRALEPQHEAASLAR